MSKDEREGETIVKSRTLSFESVDASYSPCESMIRSATLPSVRPIEDERFGPYGDPHRVSQAARSELETRIFLDVMQPRMSALLDRILQSGKSRSSGCIMSFPVLHVLQEEVEQEGLAFAILAGDGHDSDFSFVVRFDQKTVRMLSMSGTNMPFTTLMICSTRPLSSLTTKGKIKMDRNTRTVNSFMTFL